MEFEFTKDFITEQATAKLSMGHEAFATWLQQEGQDPHWIDELLANIVLLQERRLPELKLIGSEFSLLVNQDEAQVVNHSLLGSPENELEKDLHFYDLESQACCGLEDFAHLLESWQEFVQQS